MCLQAELLEKVCGNEVQLIRKANSADSAFQERHHNTESLGEFLAQRRKGA
jgi:hypothetical protein